jgi:hypothetical protein
MTIFWICFFILAVLALGFVLLLAAAAAIVFVGNDFDDVNDIYLPKGPKNDYEGKS